MPDYLREVIATVSHVARASAHVNQRSGVSVRLSVTNLEVGCRQRPAPRACRPGRRSAVARVDDLSAMTASSSGKIEIETLDDGAQGAIFDNLVRAAVLAVYRQRVPAELTRAVTQAFDEGAVIDVGEDIPSAQTRRPGGDDPGPRPPGRGAHRRRRLRRRRLPRLSPSCSRGCTSPSG